MDLKKPLQLREVPLSTSQTLQSVIARNRIILQAEQKLRKMHALTGWENIF